MISRETVRTAVESSFPDQETADILELLDVYGIEPHERERERVHLAVLKLSKGDLDLLLYNIEAAKRDYRDVLYWAENPPTNSV